MITRKGRVTSFKGEKTMARQQIITFTCDIDGSDKNVKERELPGGRTIDLCESCEAKLDKALQPFMDKSSKAAVKTVKPARSASASAAQVKEFNANVRAWVKDNGINMPSRGRVPEEVLAAFKAKDVDALDSYATSKQWARDTIVSAKAAKAAPAKKTTPAKKTAPKPAEKVNGSDEMPEALKEVLTIA